MHRVVYAVLVLALAAGSCGGGGMTLNEFATEGEVLTRTVIEGIAELDEEWLAQTPTDEGARGYWEARIRFREEFYEGVQELDPPEGLEEMHTYALDVFGRLLEAERAMAAQVEAAGVTEEHWAWWNTPEGAAARAIDNEGIALCIAAQEDFDATQDRAALSDTPWIPTEMREVVRVAYGCPEFLEE